MEKQSQIFDMLIVPIAGSMKELETLVTDVNLASKQAGLNLNTQKTKVIRKSSSR